LLPICVFAQVPIGTSSTANATAAAPQRKIIFDTANNTYWAFSYTGSAINYSRSTDGISWTSVGTLPFNTADFAVTFKRANNFSHIYIAAQANNFDVVAQRGLLSSTAITFDTAVTAFDGTSPADTFRNPTIALSANDTLWVSAIRTADARLADNKQVFVRRGSQFSSITGVNFTSFPANPIGRKSGNLQSAVILPRVNSEMYLLVSGDGANINGYQYDGTNWTEATTGGDLSWFNFPGGGVGLTVSALTIYNGELYVGGSFLDVGGTSNADYLVKWNGTTFVPIGTFNGAVRTLATGNASLYIGGDFTSVNADSSLNHIAQWDGSSFSALNAGVNGPVHAVKVDASAVYVGGAFTNAGGITTADNIAVWAANAWGTVDQGTDGAVNAIEKFGSDIYIGGAFLNAIGRSGTARIAVFNGTQFNTVNGGLNNNVSALAAASTQLFVGGDFTTAGGLGTGADYLAAFNGSSWQAVGTVSLNAPVISLAVNPNNNDVYVGGFFTSVDNQSGLDYLARWNGSNWLAVNTTLNAPVTAITYNTGVGVIVGGIFTDAGGDVSADYLARDTGGVWAGYAPASLFNGAVKAMAQVGNDLYVGGEFTDVDGNPAADYLVKWDGTTWSALGSGGIPAPVRALAVIGTDLYVGGEFSDIDGIGTRSRIAKWDGANWSALGTGVGNTVYALAALGTDLYIGGDFINVGGSNGNGIVRWNGASFSGLGSGVTILSTGEGVKAIVIQGTDVYVGGRFTQAGGVSSTSGIARWNSGGNTWSALESGLSGDVLALAASSTDLYVGGAFNNLGSDAAADLIARYNFTDTTFHALGTGISGIVSSLLYSGSKLLVGGSFIAAGGTTGADYIAEWNGTSFSALGNGVNGKVDSLFNYGGRLFVGGSFITADGLSSPNFAKYATAVAAKPLLSAGISAISDTAGKITFAYNGGPGLNLRSYISGGAPAWQPVTSVSSNPALSLTLSANLNAAETFVIYSDNINVYYKKQLGNSAFGSEQLLYNSANPNSHVTSAQFVGNGRILVGFTVGSGAYQVIASIINDSSLLRGNITRAGQPLAGVTLDAGALGGVLTNSAGDYTFGIFENGTSYSVTPTLTNHSFVPTSASGLLIANTSADFVGTFQGVTIFGTITQNGTPLSGVTVDGGSFGTKITDSNGFYSFDLVNGDSYTFTPLLTGYAFSPTSRSGTIDGGLITPVNFSANLLQFIVGGVVKTASGRPIPGVTVVSPELGTTTTNTSGLFGYRNTNYGTTYTYTAARTGFTLTPSSGGGTATSAILDTITGDPITFSISGTVTSADSTTLSGITINGGSLGNQVTNGSGQYTFANVPFNTLYSVRPVLAGFSVAPVSAGGQLTANASHSFVGTAILYRLSGVVKLRGKPLAKVVIDGKELGKKTTDSAGRFSFANISPGTAFTLFPSLTGYTFNPFGVAGVLTRDTAITFVVKSKASYGSSMDRPSIASDGTEADGDTTDAALSGDANTVAFVANASTLVESDTNGVADVFIRIRDKSTTQRISENEAGVEGNAASGTVVANERSVSLSSDGEFVAYTASATNLITDDFNSAEDVFLYKVSQNQTSLVSASAAGAQGDAASYGAFTTSSGAKVTFTSAATNLVSGDTNSATDIFIKTVSDGAISRVSVSESAAEANGNSRAAYPSGDGSLVVFESDATNMVTSDTNSSADIFVRNIALETTSRVSVSSAGVEANGASSLPVISGDGKIVAFLSAASNLVTGDSNGVTDVFVRDIAKATTERISVSSAGSQANAASIGQLGISVDGRYVTFTSSASNLVGEDTNSKADIFVYDRATQRTGRISRTIAGVMANGSSKNPTVSLDGQNISYISDATNLVDDDTNGKADAFVSMIPDLPAVFKNKIIISQPPELVVDARNVTVVMQPFVTTSSKSSQKTKTALAITKDVGIKATKQKITYVVTVTNTNKKNDVKKIIAKRNTLTVRNLGAGSYSTKYAVKVTTGKKTTGQSKNSPSQKFTVK